MAFKQDCTCRHIRSHSHHEALIDKGLIKARNFKNNNNKMAYAYLMTPAGIEEKARVTVNFLRRKVTEYESLQREIEELRREVRESGLPTEREL